METTIGIIEKSKTEEPRIALKKFKQHDYLDIRTYVEPYADEGQGRVPSKKGITIPVPKLPDLIAALQKAEEEARAAGLLKDMGGGA